MLYHLSLWIVVALLVTSPIGARAVAAAQDTVVVRVADTPTWGPAPELVEEVRIGTVDGDPNYTLGLVRSLAVASSGDLWILDGLSVSIRRFSASGEYIADVGRAGEGPGEFSFPLEVRRDGDGVMMVLDPANARIHRFDEQGEVLESFPVRAGGHFVSRVIPSMQLDPAGFSYSLDLAGGSPREGYSRFTWTVREPAGRVVDSIPVPLSRSTGPIHSQTLVSPLGHLVSGRNDEYVFHSALVDDRVLRMEGPEERIRYTRGERAEAQRLEDFFSARRSTDPTRIPAEKPVWEYFWIDTDARIWVAKYAESSQVDASELESPMWESIGNPPRTHVQPIVFDVISSDGELFGTVSVPGARTKDPGSRVELLHAQGQKVWMLERGNFDEHYVVQYRIERNEE